MPKLGIVGYTNSGKTTLFNALTGLVAHAAPHPFTTTEPNVGVAEVVDDRLDAAAEIEGSAKLAHATLELLDLPALSTGGGGMAAQFLGRLRTMEGLVVVLRAFVDDAVIAEEGGFDPVDQAETIALELALADADVFNRRAEKAAKEATADASRKREAAAVATGAELLSEGGQLRSRSWSTEERDAFRDLAPLTLKPVVWVVNVSEDEDPADLVAKVGAVVPEGDTVVALSAQIEAEAAELDPAERASMLEDLGLGAGALDTIVHAAYDALGLQSFYTLGPKEAHAWTVRRGASAREAAGKIHSDLERGFIRAEVAPIGDVVAAGGWDAAKAAGIVRLEGKEYVVAEGDVLLIRFSV